jgi:CPA2 family monovalent cation:H+ antiporter-2
MTAVVLGFKAILIWFIVFALGFGSRVATLAGMALAQVGEFSFILAQEGAAVGLLDSAMHARVIGVSVLTMLLTPFAIIAAPRLARRAPRLAWLEAVLARRGGSLMSVRPALAEREEHMQRRVERLQEHVIIVGFGVNGVNVARVLRQLSVPYVILEINPEAVRVHREAGELVRFGDATRDAILQSVGVTRARAVVLAIADPASSRTIVRKARRMNPDLFIIVRTRFVTEVDELYVLGADEVVPEEFETSLELAGRIMTNFGVPERLINREKSLIRQERYRLLRGERRRVAMLPTLETMLASADFAEVPLDAASPAVGRNLRELDLRHRTGASVIGVCRNDVPISNPSREFTLMADDLVLLFGSGEQLEAAEQELTGLAPGDPAPDDPALEHQPVDDAPADGANGTSK